MFDGQTAYIVTLSLTAVVTTGLIVLAWQRRHMTGAYALMALAVALVVWGITEALEGAARDVATMVIISKLSYFGIASVPPLWLVFAIQRTGSRGWISRRALLLLALPSAVMLPLVLTNEWHGLVWAELSLAELDDFSLLEPTHGPAFWVFAAYAYTMIFAATYLLVRVALRSLRGDRAQVIVLIVSVLVPSAASLMHVLGLPPLVYIDLTPLIFSISALIVGWMLLRLDSLHNLPVAHRTIIENMEDGVLVVDLSGTIIDANSAAARLLGWPNEALAGERLITVLIDHPEVRQLYQELTAPGSDQRRDETLLGRDKVETFVELSVLDLSAIDGNTVGQVIVIRDITERKQAQVQAARRMAELTALRQIDQLISSTLEVQVVLENALDSALRMTGADAGFISLSEDKHQVIVHTSDGYPLPLVGKHLAAADGITGRVIRNQRPEFVVNVRADPDYVADRMATRSQMVVPLVVHDRLVGLLTLEADDPQRFIEGGYEFVRLLAGHIAAAVDNARLYTMTQNQLSKLEELYVQVSELEKLKTDMIRLASHDLRNPLGTMVICLDLMASEEDKLTPEHRRHLDLLIRLTHQIERLVNEILSSERYQQQGMQQDVDIQSLVCRVLVEHDDSLRDKLLVLRTDLPAEPVLVLGDESQLREALANLMSNAIKYTPEGGQVRVSLKTVRDVVVFNVADTGYGIPQEMQERLFQPFYRAISQKTQRIDGTGLGLSLVKSIIERHRGRVHFHSVYGEGSTFGFDLPLVSAEPSQVDTARQMDR